MEKKYRTRKRVSVSLDAELISSGKGYVGVIENFSENGLKWYQYAKATDFTPGTTVKVKLRLPSGERLHLHCNVKWSYKTPPHGSTYTTGIDPPPEYTAVGMEIIDPPSKYKEFFKTLY